MSIVSQVAKRVPVALLQKFTDVWIGDSTTLTLPDELAEQFPGCGGSGKTSKAALKIQVLWSLATGQLSLRKAAAIVRDWIVLLSEVLDDRRLGDLLRRLEVALAETARVSRRKKHPSLFQRLENPELLEYTVA